MFSSQFQWTEGSGWSPKIQANPEVDLVLVFGDPVLLGNEGSLTQVRACFPNAVVTGCSTAGEIHGPTVSDGTMSVTAIAFDSTTVRHLTVDLGDHDGCSKEAGVAAATQLDHDDLAHVFVLSEGLSVNGSELVAGLASCLPDSVSITGGLAADADRFEHTVVVSGDRVGSGLISIVGLYGSSLQVGTASLGGWDQFGPERIVTKSSGNVLYELDGKSALDLYCEYLGEDAEGLPATGLQFPLSIRTDLSETPIVRTLLAIDRDASSMTFAGDIPQGAYARLMKANFDRLIDGAAGAARNTGQNHGVAPDLAILISCVGRKIVLRQRVEEELEAVEEVFGSSTTLTGFYSYGEISPFTPNATCELHNQTMTVTTLTES